MLLKEYIKFTKPESLCELKNQYFFQTDSMLFFVGVWI